MRPPGPITATSTIRLPLRVLPGVFALRMNCSICGAQLVRTRNPFGPRFGRKAEVPVFGPMLAMSVPDSFGAAVCRVPGGCGRGQAQHAAAGRPGGRTAHSVGPRCLPRQVRSAIGPGAPAGRPLRSPAPG